MLSSGQKGFPVSLGASLLISGSQEQAEECESVENVAGSGIVARSCVPGRLGDAAATCASLQGGSLLPPPTSSLQGELEPPANVGKVRAGSYSHHKLLSAFENRAE